VTLASRQLVNMWKHYYETRGDVHNKSRPGHSRKTTIKEDKIIKRQSVADPQKPATAIIKN